MKKMNKVIAATMLMAITFATPAMAGNKKPNNHDKKVEAVHNDKKAGHFDKHTAHFDKHHAPRPDMKICTVHLNRLVAIQHIISKEAPACTSLQVGVVPRTFFDVSENG